MHLGDLRRGHRRLLLEPLAAERGVMESTIARTIHDAGHAAGLGLRRKVNDNLIPGYWYRGVEEWRADGIGFEIGTRLLDATAAADDVASNFVVRFGLSAPTATAGLDGPHEHIV